MEQKLKKMNELICKVCSRNDIVLYKTIVATDPMNKSENPLALTCVRCGTIICDGCKRKMPKHSASSRDGQLCPACDQYTIFELAGKDDYSDLLRQAEMRYGLTKK
ncbi:MAG: hypothetical protein FWG22_02840 [Prolixibacteraceae bacterium]|nr:hypothetical protein [Prolixibacteraceae bacterium]